MLNSPIPPMTRLAIQDLLTEFAYRIDNGEAATVHELFVAEARLETPQFVLESRDEICRHFTARAEDTSRKTRHYWSNPRFSGDDREVVVVSNTLTVISVPAAPTVVMSGRSTDVFTPHGDGWAFSSRRLDGVILGALGPPLGPS